MNYWKVVNKKGDDTRVRYFKGEGMDRDEAAQIMRTIYALVPRGWAGWEIVSVTAASEADFVRFQQRR